MSKKQLLIIILVFILAAAITLGFFLWRKNSDTPTQQNNNGGFESFFPVPDGTENGFGGTPSLDPNNTNPDNQNTTGSQNNIPRLRMLSSEPVSGFISYEVAASSTPFGIVPISTSTPTLSEEDSSTTTNASSTLVIRNGLRYVQRATGHIYETTDFSLLQERVSNTTIPKVYETYFTSSTSPILRYLDNDQIISYRANINELTDSTQGTFLPNKISEMAISPNGSQFASLVTTDTQSELHVYSSNNTSRNIFSSFTKQWNVQWPNPEKIYLTNKADSRYLGLVYSINPQNGSNEIILSGYPGLTTNFNASGTKAFISYVSTQGISSAIYDVSTREASNPLSISTFAEKCVWSKINPDIIYCAVPQDRLDTSLPQRWYQGVVTFDDIVFKIDTSSLQQTLVISSEDISPNDFDIIKPTLSPDEKFLYFVNKKDLTLWSYELISSDTSAEQ